MDIKELKQRLSIIETAEYLGIKVDKHGRALCPFHDDKKPSLQFSKEKNIATCFSANCGAGTMDIVSLTEKYLGISTREAVLRLQEQTGSLLPAPLKTSLSEKERIDVLSQAFIYFENGLKFSDKAKNYLHTRGLVQAAPGRGGIEVGYHAGNFHYRPNKHLRQAALQTGLLYEQKSRVGYGSFAKDSLVFPLKDKKNNIVGLYFRMLPEEEKEQTIKHLYLKDRQGLYPHYPKAETEKLILTESIIDAATLLLNLDIIKEYGILACYGTNGLTEEHIKAVKELKELKEIIFFFDGDEAGKEGVRKYETTLKETVPNVIVTHVPLPEGEDVNSLYTAHEKEVLSHLLNQRIAAEQPENRDIPLIQNPIPSQLDTSNPQNIIFQGIAAEYTLKGILKSPSDSLKTAVQIIHRQTKEDYRTKIDLYEYKQGTAAAEAAADRLGLRKDLIEQDFMMLTRLSEKFREEYLKKQASEGTNRRTFVHIPESEVKQCIGFLKQPHLLERLNEKIGKAGVTGEENNRMLLFIIASSYKMKETLHALIQGSSGSGKTRLLKVISDLMPPEDVKRFTRVTDSSLYNYGEYDLVNMLLCFEDTDGLKEDAQLALRELQSNDLLISSTSVKDEQGNIRSAERIVRGPIASLSCTTKGDTYEDNISRCFVLAVDESKTQTQKIIDYQNKKAAGKINKEEEQEVKKFIQNCMRLLKPYDVINPYADKIKLPEEAHKIRRLNDMYQSIVKQITVLYQYQRKKDEQGRLITDKEDLKAACGLLFESIVLKVDELDGSLRQFYEQLKKYVGEKGEGREFNRFEIRKATGVSKTQQHRYIQMLLHLEYLKQYGFANRGYTYEIAHWDHMQTLRNKIKEQLEKQLQNL